MSKVYREETEKSFDYKIIFSRRRTLSIIVSPDKGVTVKAPLRTPLKVIESFIESKSGWIIKSLNSFKSLKKIDGSVGGDADKFLFEGKEFTLSFARSEKFNITFVDGNFIRIGIPDENNSAVIKTKFDLWLKNEARKRLTEHFARILAKYSNYGFYPTGFAVSTMKKRWGSCSSKGKIAISSDLVRIDPVFAEYVIIHELCHLRHHNHSDAYYRFLSDLYPGWKEVRNELRKYIR